MTSTSASHRVLEQALARRRRKPPRTSERIHMFAYYLNSYSRLQIWSQTQRRMINACLNCLNQTILEHELTCWICKVINPLFFFLLLTGELTRWQLKIISYTVHIIILVQRIYNVQWMYFIFLTFSDSEEFSGLTSRASAPGGRIHLSDGKRLSVVYFSTLVTRVA